MAQSLIFLRSKLPEVEVAQGCNCSDENAGNDHNEGIFGYFQSPPKAIGKMLPLDSCSLILFDNHTSGTISPDFPEPNH